MQWKFIVSLIAAFVVAIFAIQNSDPVDIKFLVASANMSQALVILISASLGAVVAIFLGLLKQFSLNKSVKEKSKQIQSLESEVSSLRDENRALNDSLAVLNAREPLSSDSKSESSNETKVLDYRE